jgi:hypothetical protein
MKYNVTNVSASSEKGARSVFLTEAGRLLKPGEKVPVNRVDAGTWVLEKDGVLKIEEGDFEPLPIFPPKAPPAPEEPELPSGPRAEDVAARKAEQEAMDRRLAEAEAKAEVKVDADSKPDVVPAPTGKRRNGRF